jgi:glycosyltransferase involved in cell wall biosynthesis
MPNRPLVSVVTPTLNQAPFLERTLSSVRGQTYPNVEHIVVDGGSTDLSLDLLRAAGDAGTIRWHSEPDAGMYDAIGKGLALAKGEVLGYLNSDDVYLPWAIDTVMAVFQQHADADVVFGDGIKIDQGTGAQRLRIFPAFDRVSLANYESLMQPAVFWRSSLFERLGGFDRSMRYVADLDFWLRAAEAGAGITHVDEVIAVERIHAGRLSAAHREAMATEDRDMRARHAGAHGGRQGRELAKERDMRLQVLLFRHFLFAWVVRRAPARGAGRWSQFLRHGRVRVNWRQALDGSQPYRSKLLWNAVTSAVAAEVAGVQAPPSASQQPRALARRLARRFLPRPIRRVARRVLKGARVVLRASRE